MVGDLAFIYFQFDFNMVVAMKWLKLIFVIPLICFLVITNMKVLNFGAKKEFVDRYDIQEFLRANHLTDEQIVEDITAVIG